MSEKEPSGSGDSWTPKRLLDWSADFFQQKGVPNPRVDSEWLLAHVLRCRRIDLYLQFDRPLNADELGAYRELVRARAARQPVAYLVGEAEFWGLPLAVRPGCLIPRQDTETLVEIVLEVIGALRADLAPGEAMRVMEHGVGSGAIPLAVFSEVEGLCWAATEASPQAVVVAQENRRRHEGLQGPRGNRLHLVRSRSLEVFASGYRPHLLVSNPPYIPSAEIDTLEPEVSQAEPRMALDGGPDGLAPHGELLDAAGRVLIPGGRILLEIGYDQGAAVRSMVERRDDLRLVAIHQDLGGKERVLHAERVSMGA